MARETFMSAVKQINRLWVQSRRCGRKNSAAQAPLYFSDSPGACPEGSYEHQGNTIVRRSQ